MRVVLDSNILLSALISPHAPPHRIYQAWRQGRFELVTGTIQLVFHLQLHLLAERVAPCVR